MKRYLLFLGFSFFLNPANSQNYQLLDSLRFARINLVTGFQNDSSGNLYIGGHYGPANHDYISKAGVYLKKYDSHGNMLWTDTANFSWAGNCTGIATDKSGNTYLAGYIGSYNKSIRFGFFLLTTDSVYYTNMFLIKYNPNGIVLWARLIKNINPKAITIDNHSNIYVTGHCGPADNVTAQLDAFSLSGGFVAKFDSSGTCINAISGFSTLVWTIACDGTNIFFCDHVSNNLCYLRKYDPSFNQVWAIPFTDPGYLKADSLGNCYMWGWFYGGSTSFGNTTLYNPYSSTGHPQGYAGKIDKNGNCLWAITPSDTETIYNVAFGPTGFYTTGSTNNISCADQRLYVAQYDSSGNFISQNQFTPQLTGRQLLCANNGDISVAGNYISMSDNFVFLSKISYNTPTSVKDPQNTSSLSLAPNPTSGIFQLNYITSRAVTVTLNILNAKGQILFSEKIKTEGELHRTLDLSAYAKGVYFIELVNGEAREVKRVVLE
jgi:hypothetical protein